MERVSFSPEQVYSVYDKKSSSYLQPFIRKHLADATRALSMALEEKGSPISKWPADFALYLLGHWDPSTGCITPTSHGGPQLVIEVSALVPPERMVPNA